MTKEIAILENPEFGKVRVIMDANDNPWFVANEICTLLDLENVSRALDGLDQDEKSVLASIANSKSSNDFGDLRANARIISESGLYNLIFKSRKPTAKKFYKWVRAELLPKYRRGELSLPENYADALEKLAKEVRAKELAQAQLTITDAKYSELDEKYQISQMRLGEHPDYHKVSEDPYIRGTFKSTSFGLIGGELVRLSHKLNIPIKSTPHPVVGSVNVYGIDALMAFKAICEHDPEYLKNCRLAEEE